MKSLLFTFTLGLSVCSWANQDLLHLSIHAKSQHSSYSAWEQDQLNPTQLITELARASIRKKTKNHLCKDLLSLSSAELAHFADGIESNLLLQTFACYEQLNQRIDAYYTRKNIPLSNGDHFGPATTKTLEAAEGLRVVDADLSSGEIALTFDDGPHGTRTPKLLEILKNENLKVNFFTVGQNAQRHHQIIKDAAKAGHIIGNHSWDHPDMRRLDTKDALAQIHRTFDLLHRLLGSIHLFFRFPYGAHTSSLRNGLDRTKTFEFFWNIDTWDWKYPDPDFLLDYALKQVDQAGKGVVLFHDIQRQTIAIMPEFLRELKRRGYKPVLLVSETHDQVPLFQ